jgi:hypothetical protein
MTKLCVDLDVYRSLSGGYLDAACRAIALFICALAEPTDTHKRRAPVAETLEEYARYRPESRTHKL